MLYYVRDERTRPEKQCDHKVMGCKIDRYVELYHNPATHEKTALGSAFSKPRRFHALLSLLLHSSERRFVLLYTTHALKSRV